jgi:DNA mismatch repair protein MutS
MTDDLTPMRQQYLEIKAQHPDAILLFRLGDFYEAFDEDAEIVSRELEITLTGRPNRNGRTPMAGVPHHAVDSYVARLIERGYHVVIADQMEPPGKKLVRREVTKVITPGTVVEPGMLNQRRNNYLLAIAPETDRTGSSWVRAGIAYVDITTGEFAATQVAGKEGEGATMAVLEELARLSPREVLLPKSWAERGISLPEGIFLTAQDDARFTLAKARKMVGDHFEVQTLDGFGLADKPLGAVAAGVILAYLRDTQRGSLPQITNLRTYNTAQFMVLDANTRRNLEITETMRGHAHGSLLSVLDRTVTPMGARLLRTWLSQPLLQIDRLNMRLECVQAFVDNGMMRAEAMEGMKAIADLERLINRALAGVATPRDVLVLRAGLEMVPALRKALFGVPVLQSLWERLDEVPEAIDLIERAIQETTPAQLKDRVGVIKAGFSAELDDLESQTRHARQWIDGLEASERARTGIKSLKVGFNKVFGYYIEISNNKAEKAPDDYIRKQTLANAERYITPQLKEYETLVLNAEERMLEIEARLFGEVCGQLGVLANRILRTGRAVAHVDAFAALAEAAAREGYVRPTLTEKDILHIRDGRHPVVEKLLQSGRYVPNDTHFDEAARIHVITGPNMAGKSTVIRQVAIITLMAQAGSFVPAAEATIGVVDRIFTRIGAQDEIHAGQSTFMVEMTETAAILAAGSGRSLLILDEIGRGTSTYDGLAIARAVIEYIHNNPALNCKTLFATHYHELTDLAHILPRVRNYNVSVLEDGEKVVFLHKLVEGRADRSYGIYVAQLAGMPKSLVVRAKQILADLESTGSNFALAQPGRAGRSKALPEAQLTLFQEEHPAVTMLRGLQVNDMSPMEALTKLFELQRVLRESKPNQ